MAKVSLINLDLETCDLLLSDAPEPIAARHGATLGPERQMLRTIAGATRELLAQGQVAPRWWGYLTLDVPSRDVVGACGFKGAPSRRGRSPAPEPAGEGPGRDDPRAVSTAGSAGRRSAGGKRVATSAMPAGCVI